MHPRLLYAVLPAFFAAALGPALAHADIYTWTDASGRVNVSNLDPPDGVRVTNVVHVNPEDKAREDAALNAARQAEMQSLAERVRQLQDEVELSRHQMPPPIDYRPVALPPPPAQYSTDWAAPPAQYPVSAASPAYSGCEFEWNCGSWWGGYPVSVVVVRAPNFRRFRPVHGGRYPVAAPQQPMRMASGTRRR
jgi:hypothetical protein